MKHLTTILACLTITLGSLAQGKEGKVVYERQTVFQIQMQGMNPEMERMMPRSRTDKFELVFGNNQSIWKAAEQENEDDIVTGDGGGMQIRMVAPGSSDVVYYNFDGGKRTDQRDMFDKKFIVDDSIRPLKWKMTGETKNILDMACMKATTTQISTRNTMNMDNGKMERKQVQDTSLIVAWFTNSVPVSAGPAEYQGQLPGLILEMDISNGRQVFKATSFSAKADLTTIKEPQGKKHYTAEEFRKERDKMMDEMQKNNGGGQRMIRMN